MNRGLQASVDQLRAQGVREADIEPSGFLEAVWLADHGWGVDPMN